MPQAAGTAALKVGEVFTIQQRNAWPDAERWELINGTACCLSPASKVAHQNMAGRFLPIQENLPGSQAESRCLPGLVFEA